MKSIDIKDFILSFLKCHNAEEAAINAGSEPEKARIDGIRLLSRKSVGQEIKKMCKSDADEETEIRSGLERLAYGRINDAVCLAFEDDVTLDKILRADLYNVSEIKRVKGGGIEIKFFDRLKALERLSELNLIIRNDKQAKNLVKSIYGSECVSVESDIPSDGEQNE